MVLLWAPNHQGPVKNTFLRRRGKQIRDVILIMGLEPVQVPCIVCTWARWVDVKAILPLMLKRAL